MSTATATGAVGGGTLHEQARALVDEAFAGLSVTVPGGTTTAPLAFPELRRGARRGGRTGRVRNLTLVDIGDGTLLWREPIRDSALLGPRRRGAVAPGPPGEVIHSVPVEELEPNKVVEFLHGVDAKLTPNQGLRRLSWDAAHGEFAFEPVAGYPGGPSRAPIAAATRRVLLIVHGTFSNGDHIADQLRQTEPAGFFAWAKSNYDEVFSFDHPTLSVSPLLNALDLARLFAEAKVPVDVICHSRGGLVVRWWLEAFAGASVGPRRAVFVASPLGGTSLASPPKLRAAIDLFTSVGSFLKTAGTAASAYLPFMTVAVGLLTVFTSVTGLVANTPLADAAFAMVPGLGGQSRVGNNEELNRLHAGAVTSLPQYFAVQSDFRPEAVGWAFWRYFVNLGDRLTSQAAGLVFNQSNDLVVDTRSMTEMLPGKALNPANRVLDFGNNPDVHHTNYFLQKATVGFFKKVLT
jgi:hypothetical protein